MCDEIRLALAEVRRRTPSAEPAFGPRGTTPRLTVRGTAAGAPPPPPPPHCLGAVGSGTLAMHCLTARGSGQWTFCNALSHCLGAVGSGTRATHCLTAWGQWAVDPPQCTAQGVLAMSCSGRGEAALSKNRAHRPGGDGASSPGGGRSILQGPWGGSFVQKPGTPARGTGSPAQGVVGVSLWAHGEAASSKNRAHRPGGTGSPAQGGVRNLLQGPRGANICREPGAPAWGGRGAQPMGCSEPPTRPMRGHHLRRTGRTGLGGTGSLAQGVFGASYKANGGPSSSENRAHRPGGDGESCPGGVRNLLQGQWGAICFRDPGAPALGGRGVQPRRCSEPLARPMGGHLL